jgi:hypothetical protein
VAHADQPRNQGRQWYASYHEYFLTGILGDSDVKLKAGDRLLFKVTKA